MSTIFSTGNVGCSIGDMQLLISGGNLEERKALAAEVAEAGGVISKLQATVTELQAALKSEQAAHLATKAKVPPPVPARMSGAAVVRFDSNGQPWLMNKVETGWGSFGLWFRDMDQLFREWNVRVVSHGIDTTGLYFNVVPSESAS